MENRISEVLSFDFFITNEKLRFRNFRRSNSQTSADKQIPKKSINKSVVFFENHEHVIFRIDPKLFETGFAEVWRREEV